MSVPKSNRVKYLIWFINGFDAYKAFDRRYCSRLTLETAPSGVERSLGSIGLFPELKTMHEDIRLIRSCTGTP